MLIDCAVVGRRVSMDHSSRLDVVVSSRSSRVMLLLIAFNTQSVSIKRCKTLFLAVIFSFILYRC